MRPAGQPHGALGDGQHLTAGSAGVLGGGVEEDADLHAGVGQVAEPAAQDVGGAVVGRGEADDDAQGGRLPGAVGSQEPGDASGPSGEGDVVDGGEVAVGLGDVVDGDHRLHRSGACRRGRSVLALGVLKPLTMR